MPRTGKHHGRVKAVAGVAIITKFAMLNFVPVWPLRSFYQLGATAGNSAIMAALISR